MEGLAGDRRQDGRHRGPPARLWDSETPQQNPQGERERTVGEQIGQHLSRRYGQRLSPEGLEGKPSH